MLTGFAGRLGAVALAVALAAAPASAQVTNLDNLTEAQQNEMYCVRIKLANKDTRRLVAHLYLYTEVVDLEPWENQIKAGKLVDDAVAGCASRYNWSKDAKDSAKSIGIFSASLDYLVQDLSSHGVTDKQLDNVLDILGTLSKDDMKALAGGSLTIGETLKTRINGQLRAAGLPGNADTLESGRRLLQATILASLATDVWTGKILK